MTPAKCNYMIYDKELLAFVKSFEIWRPELASVNEPVRILTNHHNLKHFMTTKQLNRQQARWAKFLSKFNFKISYRPGKEGEKPDILTTLAQNKPTGVDDFCHQQQFQTLLKADRLNEDIKKALTVVFRANKIDEINEIDEIDEIDEVKEANEVDEVDEVDMDSKIEKNKDIIDVRDYIDQNLY